MDERAQLRKWLCELALPLWADRGYDRARARFAERLTFECEPVRDVPLRLMVQARQVAVFCDAERLGWMTGSGEPALAAAHSMIEDFQGKGDLGGWAFACDENGQVVDTTPDLYAHAFALYALSHCHRLDPTGPWLATARDTLAFVQSHFAHPGGGYLPALPAPQHLAQNPLMHLLEALLDLFEASGEDQFANHARDLASLAVTRMIDPATGALPEAFDGDWNPRAENLGNWVEPGHQYEWIWLLDRAERLLGGDHGDAIDGLHRFAVAHGIDAAGFLVDEVEPDGAPRKTSRRLWPHTEGLRAERLLARRGNPSTSTRVEAFARRLREGFLATAPAGGWVDRIDAAGAPLSPDMPASSLYHLAGAIEVLGEMPPA
ncbi:MAG: AGE family epimerase/isomerase [Rhodobiaceae bacterium]|nr:AGE family epimerase/isomerase [Rhodobiaceae bacterium]MCC0016793.1 AGE family epimerase/isomerase [Rhodobiaceae bacterium]MCC0042600.1 AGE family epimerase/isomerase [Rhodobiaceae bacterium]